MIEAIFQQVWEIYGVVSMVFVTPAAVALGIVYWRYNRREMREYRAWLRTQKYGK